MTSTGLNNGLIDTSESSRSCWRRNLYEKTGLPDNFTPDDCFLAAIRRNQNVRRYSLRQCLPKACLVSLQASAVVAFYACYSGLSSGLLLPSSMLLATAGAAMVGYLLVLLGGSRIEASGLRDGWRHLVVFSSFGIALAPILHRLTDTISTDTIHTASFLALLTHLLAHDYQPTEISPAHYASANALSLNASLFAAVCLASRLGSAYEAFSLLAASLLTFVLCPLLRSRLVTTTAEAAVRTVLLAVLLSAVTTAAAAVTVSTGFTLGVTLAQIFVFVAPAIFVQWQDYKDTINGPWDEAVPNL